MATLHPGGLESPPTRPSPTEERSRPMTTIASRMPRREYETRIAPRSLVRTFVQKLLHQWARVCIPPGLRIALYRAMGIRIGRHVFVGLDTWLDDQFPELITVEDDVTISFRVTVVVHDDAKRMDRTAAGAGRSRCGAAAISAPAAWCSPASPWASARWWAPARW